MSNYYDVLGVARGATEKDIRQAYRRLARQYHPDVNKNDAAAEDKFKEINEAYGVLSDEDSRKKYDRYGDNWRRADEYGQGGGRGPSEGGFPEMDDGDWDSLLTGGGRGPSEGGFRRTVNNSDFEDIFANFGGRGGTPFQDFSGNAGLRFEDLFTAGRGQSRRHPPPEYPVEVTLEEAFHGATRTLRLNDGRTLEVKIPPGVDQGSRVHIASGGSEGGGFYLVVSVLEHGAFQREGRDLYTEVDLEIDDAVLGAEILAPTLTGKVALTVPPNTPNDRRFRLSGLGMPELPGRGNRGDLYVTVKLILPPNLSEDEIELFRRLREIRMERSAVNGAAAAE